MRNVICGSIMFFLSACSWMPWVDSEPSQLLTISLTRGETDKAPAPLTILIVQPAEQKSFVAANYTTVAAQALDKGVSRYVMLADKKRDTLVLPVTQTPLALYFILPRQPASNWKYLIDKPQGLNELFTINQDGVVREMQDE